MIEVIDADVEDVLAICAEITDRSGTDLAPDVVSAADRTASDRRHQVADSRRVLAGRAALRLLAAARLGHDPARAGHLEIDRTCSQCARQHARPVMAGLSLSSSTSANRVMVATGPPDVALGVDIERVPGALFADFDTSALHPSERAEFAARPTDVGSRIQRWTEKEAAAKARGLGLNAPFEALRIGSATITPGTSQQWRTVVAAQPEDMIGLAVLGLEETAHYRSAIAATVPQPVRMVALREVA